ncbi:hypothetical protein F3Y22_tig00109999pilonHSYRG00015 [Hibiscus syriacus]|uniref:Uncharacterized protein n=1 Tax=Hibiscus syriacus TaxID=106335 RepID=A0A6A3BPV4_HIBSY|nr:hypothetical protein F3Y22_tig00109999pilonHSYRG00015 [Hibiscus syriacus]
MNLIRSDSRERLKMNEILMGLLFKLDSLAEIRTTLSWLSSYRTELFPLRDVPLPETMLETSEKNIVTKRVVFTASKIEEIIAKYSAENEIRPSRVEALSAFIWNNEEEDGCNLVRKITEYIRKIDKEYVKKLQAGEDLFQPPNQVWSSYASVNAINIVAFMDTTAGNGVEPWINLKEEDMNVFGSDEQLLAAIQNCLK